MWCSTALRRVLFFLMLACAGNAVPATQPVAREALQEPRFDKVGAGIIPRDVVAALAQDRSGLVWIATGDGLVRFDGYRFRVLERDSTDASRRSLGWIRTLLPARDGRLWIGTETDGLAVYDPATERVTDFGFGPEGVSGGKRPALPTIRALAEGSDGAIWVGSMGGGLARFDVGNNHFTHFRHGAQAGNLPDDQVLSLLVDRAGTVWAGSWTGLSRMARGGSHFQPVAPHLVGPQVQALHQASDGRIWVGTQRGSLVTIDPETARARRVHRGSAGPDQAAISAFAEAPGGETWVGTAVGIDILDQDLHPVRRLRHDMRKPAGLAGHEVTALMVDQAGWLWVGGFGLGLQRHNPNNRSIWLRGADMDPASRLHDASVRSLLALHNGEIWAAPQRGGIAVMDQHLRVVAEVLPRPPVQRATPRPPSAPKAEPPGVTAMAQTWDGSVWLATDEAFYRIGPDRRQRQALPSRGGLTRALLVARDGNLWAASEDGLHRLRPGATSLERVPVRDGAEPLRGAAHVLAEAPDDSIWVGTVQGLFRIAPGQHTLDPVRSPDGAGLGNQSIAGLLFDRQGTLWVDAGPAGLHRMSHWDGRQAWFDRISERHGIVNRPFGANLLADRRGRIWTQIQVFDPSTDRLITLNAVDGADLGTGWFGSHAQTQDGRMLFGGSKGVLVVRPESFDASDYAPALVATELRINGQRQSAGTLAHGLRLAPSQRSFSLEFAALDFSDPRQLRYAFRLEGFDLDWTHGGASNRVASYSNLDPGSYLLRVRATNRSGVWSPNELAIGLQVLPRWWQQWWARVFALLLAATAVWGFVHWRTRRLRAHQLELEARVLQRTAELQRLTDALNEASLTDPLTGLRNRRFLAMHIASDAAMAVRAHENHLQHGTVLASDADLVFFMFDIDHFKQVNDQYGHAAGDAVLKQMRQRLLGVFRDTDYLVRWGGEEFLVVARGTTRHFAPELAERARAAVAQAPFEIDGGIRLHRTCSVGFASFPLCSRHPLALDWQAALNVADACLYAVKDAGRNGWLGVLDVQGDTAGAIQAGARRPMAEWARTGAPVVACAPGLRGWGNPAGSPPGTT